MRAEGLSDDEARARIFMIDRSGLLTEDSEGLRDFQQALVQKRVAIRDWLFSGENPTLLDVINCAKPSILIGVSGQPGLFTESALRSLKAGCSKPIVFPLSNPIKQIEARPEQVIEWCDGEVIVATGSPFNAIDYQGKKFPIAQCNNAYIFPGIGLGVLAVGAKSISDEMMMATSETLAAESPLANGQSDDLLPKLTELKELSMKIAFNVAKVAIRQGLALEISDELLQKRIEKNFWTPEYRPYKRVSI